MKKYVKRVFILVVVNIFLLGICGCGNVIDNGDVAETNMLYANDPVIKVIYENSGANTSIETNIDSTSENDKSADLKNEDETLEYEPSTYETPQLTDKENFENDSKTNTNTITEQSLKLTDESSIHEPSTYEIPQLTRSTYSGNGSNFNTYNNEEQQQTSAKFVLNTSSMKVHFPKCSDVKKISPENYATSNESFADLQAQGYSSCGHCNAH